MITIHPAFDPSTKTWFWNEFEAKTLHALKGMIGPQTKIKDYYPDGFNDTIAFKFIKSEEKRTAVRIVPPSVALASGNFTKNTTRKRQPSYLKVENDLRHQNGGRHKRHNHDLILDLWALGMSTEDIAVKCGNGLTSNVARSTVMMARQKGDPRAVRRTSVITE